MKKSQLSKRDIKEILLNFPQAQISKKDRAELIDNSIVILNDKPLFFLKDSKYIPTLRQVIDNDLGLKKIYVDSGAIPFVIKGADIMRPGITKIDDDIEIDDFVIIVDDTHGKPLAIGQALYDSENLKKSTSGKVIRNLHFVGDHIWTM